MMRMIYGLSALGLALAAPAGFSAVHAEEVSGYFEPFEQENTLGIPAGDIVVDTGKKQLFFAYDDELLLIYPIAVGREGKAWRGSATIERAVEGPKWYPTAEQKSRRKLPDMVPAGPKNPLGEFAFYLLQNGRDTLIRIHGTNVPSSIGRAVSDGCIRMRNEHIAELYGLIEVGASVRVE